MNFEKLHWKNKKHKNVCVFVKYEFEAYAWQEIGR